MIAEMNSMKIKNSLAAVFVAWMCLFIPAQNILHADNRTAQNKRDEKNEDERVKQARKDLQQREATFSKHAKAYKSAISDQLEAERNYIQAKKKYEDERDRAEERLEEKTGIPASLKKIHTVSSEITSLSEKVKQEIHLTDDWRTANKNAKAAKVRLEALLDQQEATPDQPTVPASSKNIDDEDILESLEQAIQLPGKIETDALNKNTEIRSLRADLESLQAKHAELRKKIPDSEINRQAQVQAARTKLEEARNKLKAASDLAGRKKIEMTSSNQSLVQAKKKLEQAILADKKDSNRTPKPKPKSKAKNDD